MRSSWIMTSVLVGAVAFSGCSAGRWNQPGQSETRQAAAPPRHSSEFDASPGRSGDVRPRRPDSSPGFATPPPVPPADSLSPIRSVGFLRDLGAKMRRPLSGQPTSDVVVSTTCTVKDPCVADNCGDAGASVTERCGAHCGDSSTKTPGCTDDCIAENTCSEGCRDLACTPAPRRGLLNRLFGHSLCDKRKPDCGESCAATDPFATQADSGCTPCDRNGAGTCGEPACGGQGNGCTAGVDWSAGCGDAEAAPAPPEPTRTARNPAIADPASELFPEWHLTQPAADQQPAPAGNSRSPFPVNGQPSASAGQMVPGVHRGSVSGPIEPPRWHRSRGSVAAATVISSESHVPAVPESGIVSPAATNEVPVIIPRPRL